jgi:hypothetical protein
MRFETIGSTRRRASVLISVRLFITGKRNIHEENGPRYKLDVGDILFIEAIVAFS